MKQRDGLSEALEDYLEAIYRTILRKSGVRVKNIAEQLGVRNPSVTSALKSLEKRGLINYEPYGVISLTKKGLEAAVKLTEKHRL
ncbi:MAG TPA: metal-dependent transcriptional regulator, partial [Magnetospirillaceae bacterium]|nr:metal-dependent transcriptional regulator [Magnetospirillaceae bacterium]